MGDVMELARSRRLGASLRVPPLGTPELAALPLARPEDLEAEYYLRVGALDSPGVLARIAGALGEAGISIASVLQEERRAARVVPIVITTHIARQASLDTALHGIERLAEVTQPVQVIRIERGI